MRTAAGTAEDITAHIRPLAQGIKDFAGAINYVVAKGIETDSRFAKGRANQPWLAIIDNGFRVAEGILSTKSIPAQHAKSFELAYRLCANSRRMPRDILKWWKKNEKIIQLLVEAAVYWPEKQEDDLLDVGSFKVHNIVGAQGAKLVKIEKIVSQAEKWVRRKPLKGIEKTLYGELYVVKQITKAHSAAWYRPSDDSVYLRLVRESDKAISQDLVHELGHRYWRKFAPNDKKREWVNHHDAIGRKDAKVVWPSIGDVIPVRAPHQKGDSILIKDEGSIYYFQAMVKGVERVGRVSKKVIYNHLLREAMEANYPTDYSFTSAEEHFCDALKLRATGDLDGEHRLAFDRIWN